jgi:hypothetical protein
MTSHQCILCLDSDAEVASFNNFYNCGCRFNAHHQCFQEYQRNFQTCMYCRQQPLRQLTPPQVNTMNPYRPDPFHQDCIQLVQIMNRIHSRFNNNFIHNNLNELDRFRNCMNILQNEINNMYIIENGPL